MHIGLIIFKAFMSEKFVKSTSGINEKLLLKTIVLIVC